MLMIVQHLFGNIFDDSKITTTRLTNFAEDAENRLKSQNTGGEFDEIISYFQSPVEKIRTQITNLDVALGIQKGKTLTTDQFIALFKKTMSVKEGVIADAVGGFNTPGFIEFYPHGVSEYTKGTKTQMPTLINRVYDVATNHEAQLSPALLATLQAFKISWENNREGQQQQKGTVSDTRDDRNSLRINLEIGMLQAIHAVALRFPNNIDHCTSFFDFNLLYPVSRSKKNQQPTPPTQ